MLTGTLEHSGLIIDWQADENEDDGFHWDICMVRQDGNGGYYSCAEMGRIMERDHAQIDNEVRACFAAAAREYQTESLLYAAGY